MALTDYIEPVLYTLGGGAVATAATKISIVWLALREDGVDADKRKEILDGLSKLLKLRKQA
ncbi:hypothetical protein ACFVUS_12390 [Nocardia sp. NPDC058058]|uniref:hypothetical protein n=1 Tax=Nocardia sp. NPDC058058 TaxID=3346317 RepID=UPI0036DD5640